MNTECLDPDRISTLPESITEKILTLMPIDDALRTSVLSKKWRYVWRSMPKLVFTHDMVKDGPGDCYGKELDKYKAVNAILHVLLLHNCPAILEFHSSVLQFDIYSEFTQIASYLASGNKVKELKLFNHFKFRLCKLPVSFFSLQGLECIRLDNCTFEPPLTFNGFSRLKKMTFVNVKVSAQILQRFLSMCPLLEEICLTGNKQGVDFAAGGDNFTFLDLLQCVPLIYTLYVTKYHVKNLSAGDMPHTLPASLSHFNYLYLDVWLMEHIDISSALCIIRSSPVLVNITIRMYDNENEKLHVQQTPTNFLDLEEHLDLKLDHLEILEIECFSNLPLEMDFVKLIMAKSPILRKVLITLKYDVSVDEELKIYKSFIRRSFLRASPSAELIIKRPKTSVSVVYVL